MATFLKKWQTLDVKLKIYFYDGNTHKQILQWTFTSKPQRKRNCRKESDAKCETARGAISKQIKLPYRIHPAKQKTTPFLAFRVSCARRRFVLSERRHIHNSAIGSHQISFPKVPRARAQLNFQTGKNAKSHHHCTSLCMGARLSPREIKPETSERRTVIKLW